MCLSRVYHVFIVYHVFTTCLLTSLLQGVDRAPGNMWMIRGACEFIPTVEMEIIDRRKAIPLDENEGIYVRDIKTGKVQYS